MKFILSVHAHVSAIVDAGKSILQLKTIEKINLAQKTCLSRLQLKDMH